MLSPLRFSLVPVAETAFVISCLLACRLSVLLRASCLCVKVYLSLYHMLFLKTRQRYRDSLVHAPHISDAFLLLPGIFQLVCRCFQARKLAIVCIFFVACFFSSLYCSLLPGQVFIVPRLVCRWPHPNEWKDSGTMSINLPMMNMGKKYK